MNKILAAFIIPACALAASSCSDWLDATPPSQIKADEHYSTVEGFQQTLTGCYIAMSDADLYGRNASWMVPGLMAGQFNPVTATSEVADLYYMQQHEYGRPSSKTFIDGMWAKAYNVIVNANDALSRIDAAAGLMTPTDYAVIKGELLAVRAMVHFDLARLYGYGDWASRPALVDAKPAVPYVTQVDKSLTPQVSMRDFFNLLCADLSTAASLLKAEDPVAGAHPWSHYDQVNTNGWYDYRSLHLNYWAVRALQARVYMLEGSQDSKALALEAAREVIGAFEGVRSIAGNTNPWRWMDANDQQTYQGMVMEQIFGLYVPDMSELNAPYIKPDMLVTDLGALHITDAERQEIYESHPSDWRMQQWYHMSAASSQNPYTCIKLEGRMGASNYYASRMPVIRIPELYYIAAECCATGPTPDLDAAATYLNDVRAHRGVYETLQGLDADALMLETAKEYRKEFPLEGVMFHFYKRLGYTDIPHSDGQAMDDSRYVLPYPDFEIQSGRVQ